MTRWWGMDNFLDGPPDLGGEVRVGEIHDSGYTLVPEPGHPAYPGAVSFEFSEANGSKWLTISGRSTAPIPAGNLDVYNYLSGVYWSQYPALISKQILHQEPRASGF